MYKNKVIILYKSLSQSEKKALHKFVHSPIHNQHTDVITLIDYLSQLKKLSPENVNRALVHKQIFKGKAFSENNIRHISSYLYKTMEDFIVFQDYSNSDDRRYKALIDFFREKGLTNHLKSSIKKYERIKDDRSKDSAYFLEKYQVLEQIAISNEKLEKVENQNFESIVDNLDQYYIAEKLKHSSTIFSHQSFFGSEHNLELMDSILTHVEEKNLLEVPVIAIHYYNYHMVKEPEDESHYEKYKSTLLQNIDIFSTKDRKDLFVLAINYNLKKSNRNAKYAKNVFDLYKLGLRNGALLPNNQISSVTYMNIINVALHIKENDWALDFIHEFKDIIEGEHKEDVFNFCLADYYCKTNDFENSLKILATVDLKAEIYNARAKGLQLKMLYECEEYEVLESLLESFWIYLKRTKHLGYHRDLWYKLIRYMKSIIHTNAGDHKRLQKILHQIKDENDLIMKKWLMKQVETLLSKR